jgi:hypothetical protein
MVIEANHPRTELRKYLCANLSVPKPAAVLDDFVRSLARRIARFPATGHVAVKNRVNAIALAPAEDFRSDSDAFGEGVRKPQAQDRIRAALNHGFQTREAEMTLARMLGELDGPRAPAH